LSWKNHLLRAAKTPAKRLRMRTRSFQRQVKADYNSKVQRRREAREDFDFEAGDQLNADDEAILRDAKRTFVIFNRVGTTADSVGRSGNRQPAGSAVPRTLGVVKKNEMLPSAAMSFRHGG
jgi:hypothetical protein